MEGDGLINVLDFVEEELEADDMHFSTPEFLMVFRELQNAKPRFDRDLEAHKEKVRQEIERRRREGIEKIGSEGQSVADIKRLEDQLEKELKGAEREMVDEFVCQWPSRNLASHEDDTIRNTVTDLLQEKHHLSRMYSNVPESDREENRLEMLVPRAITEWKSEILNQQIRKLLREFHDGISQMDIEKEQRYQAHLRSLMKLRSLIAKEIGDRILLPK